MLAEQVTAVSSPSLEPITAAATWTARMEDALQFVLRPTAFTHTNGSRIQLANALVLVGGQTHDEDGQAIALNDYRSRAHQRHHTHL